MAHLTFEEIKQALTDDAQVIVALVKSISECQSADEARAIAQHLEGVVDGGILDCLHMIDDIIAGREEDDFIYDASPKYQAKYSPKWEHISNFENPDKFKNVSLDIDDIYTCRCPECGEPVMLQTEEFFGLVAETRLDTLDCGAFCPACAKKVKEQSAEGGQA